MSARLHFTRPRRLAAAAVTTSAVVAAVGLGTAPAAQSVTTPPTTDHCTNPYPVSDLAPQAPVTGKTVTSGTDPETFNGSVLGVLEDGIGPGVDMILVDLDSPTIQKVGIWGGMSGSPVYAADGRLIGAVSYSLGLGPSTVAGVTPAAEMFKLLHAGATTTVAPRRTVKLSTALRHQVVASGAASGADSATMSRLHVPVGMSGLTTARLRTVAPALNGGGRTLVDTPASATSSEHIPIVDGGNLAAAMSYGTITSAGVGTATAVCGDQVIAFGHPMNYTGPSSMTLHGARATHIQDDQTLSGFKVANLGAPVGTIDGDRLAGLHATTAGVPPTFDVTSDATQGTTSGTAASHVSVPDLMPQIGFANMIAAQDKVIDRVGKGTVSARWTIKGLRKNGAPFSFTRNDLYADSGDVSLASAAALGNDLSAISNNPGEAVKITSIDSSSQLQDVYESYVISKVQARRDGRWVTLHQSSPSWLHAGRTTRLKVFVTSRDGQPRTLAVNTVIPPRAAGRMGTLTIVGGNIDAFSSSEFLDEGDIFFGEEDVPAPSSSAFPALLKNLTAGPKHNQVRATIRFRGAPGYAGRAHATNGTMNRVVAGHKLFRIFAR